MTQLFRQQEGHRQVLFQQFQGFTITRLGLNWRKH